MGQFVSIRRLALIMAPAVLLLASGCSEESARGHDAPPPEGKAGAIAGDLPDFSSLGGTSWRLVEIQEMNDKTFRPDDPAKYTFTFRPDGTLTIRLNCNRASGGWQAGPGEAGRGQLKIGPVAMTRAHCPQPSLDTRIARDLDYVRSYVLEDGRLNISLMADGGIYVLEPAGDFGDQEPPPQIGQ